MSKALSIAAMIAALGVGFTSPANATHTSKGLDWSLTYSGVALPDSDPTRSSYLVTLGVDTDGYTGKASFLDQISLKAFAPLASFSLVSAPSGVGSWGINSGALGALGCHGHGGGFACLNSQDSLNGGKGLSLASNNGEGIADYSWVFHVTVENGKPLARPGPDAIVLARMVNENGQKVGALGAGPLNLTVSAVPEPQTYAMMLAGIGMIGTVVRRRSRNAM